MVRHAVAMAVTLPSLTNAFSQQPTLNSDWLAFFLSFDFFAFQQVGRNRNLVSDFQADMASLLEGGY